MSETNLEIPLRVALVDEAAAVSFKFSELSAKRTALGLTVEDVSGRLKYSVKMIEALELGRLADLPHGVALKGLVKNYTRLLGIDSSALEAKLQSSIGVVTGGIANHTSTRSLAPHDAERHAKPTLWLLLIAAFVVAVLGIAIWQGVVPKNLLPEWLEALLR